MNESQKGVDDSDFAGRSCYKLPLAVKIEQQTKRFTDGYQNNFNNVIHKNRCILTDKWDESPTNQNDEHERTKATKCKASVSHNRAVKKTV